MIEVKFKEGDLTSNERLVITKGFARHSDEWEAPHFKKQRINWLAYDTQDDMIAALLADVFWDWIYVDEIWVSENHRRKGIGKALIAKAEDYAKTSSLAGLYLWTQSWQAEDFYRSLGYTEFVKFSHFPKGHFRIGFYKQFSSDSLE